MNVICFVISNAVLLHNNVSYSHPFNVTNLKIVWINSLSGKSGLHSHQTLARNLCGEIINMIFTSNMWFAVNETTMVLHFKPNVLTVYNDNNKNVIINYHKSLSCNNFPTVPSKPYISIITALIYLHVYYVMCSIVNNQSNLCILHVWTGSFSDLNRARSASTLCSVPAYGMFLLRSRHMRGSSCRFAPSRSVPASTHSPHFHELPDLLS